MSFILSPALIGLFSMSSFKLKSQNVQEKKAKLQEKHNQSGMLPLCWWSFNPLELALAPCYYLSVPNLLSDESKKTLGTIWEICPADLQALRQRIYGNEPIRLMELPADKNNKALLLFFLQVGVFLLITCRFFFCACSSNPANCGLLACLQHAELLVNRQEAMCCIFRVLCTEWPIYCSPLNVSKWISEWSHPVLFMSYTAAQPVSEPGAYIH